MNPFQYKSVIYFCDFEFSESNPAYQRILNISKFLVNNRYKVIIYFNNCNLRYLPSLRNIEFKSLNLKSKISIVINRLGLNFLRYLKIIKEKKPNYIFLYNFPSTIYLFIIIFRFYFKFKIISDVTEWHNANTLFKFLDVNLRMKFLHFKSDGLLCISSFLKNYYSDFKGKSIVIPPLIPNRINQKSIKFPKKKIKLIYTGNPSRTKDKLDEVVISFVKGNFFKYYSLKIIGLKFNDFISLYDISPEYMPIIKQQVFFLGKLSHKSTVKIIQNSDFQIIYRKNNRSNNAGFPTKFVESISNGCSTISTNTSDIKNYLINNKNGFLIEDSESSLFDIFSKLYKLDHNKIYAMKINAYKSSISLERKANKELKFFLRNL